MALKFEAVYEHTGSKHKLCVVLRAGRDYKMEQEWYYKKSSQEKSVGIVMTRSHLNRLENPFLKITIM